MASGAGISAESGVPTFRGPDGLWNGRRPEDVATLRAFRRDPVDVWEFYHARRRQLLQVVPNAGHRAIASWQERYGEVPVITQNVDGLHQIAGSRDVLELHGSLWRARCMECGVVIEDRTVSASEKGEMGVEGISHCACGGMMRPDIVWFGEELPREITARAVSIATSVDILVIVGTSNLVYPAASIPLQALASGVRVIEVNIEPTPLSSRVTKFVQGSATEILPQLESEFH